MATEAWKPQRVELCRAFVMGEGLHNRIGGAIGSQMFVKTRPPGNTWTAARYIVNGNEHYEGGAIWAVPGRMPGVHTMLNTLCEMLGLPERFSLQQRNITFGGEPLYNPRRLHTPMIQLIGPLALMAVRAREDIGQKD